MDGAELAIPLSDQWRSIPGCDIGSLESFAAEVFVLWALEQNLRQVTLVLLVDNIGVVDGWAAKRSRNGPSNLSFIRTATALQQAEVELELVYIPTAQNKADSLSRGLQTSGAAQLTLPQLPTEISEIVLK